MKLLLSLIVLMFASGTLMSQANDKTQTPSTPAASQAKTVYNPTAEESELIRLSQEWMDEALNKKNEKRLREIMDPEFTLQIWDASRAAQPFAKWLDTLKNRLAKVEFNYSGLNVNVFGNTAVVFSRFWWKGTMDGEPFTDSGFIADVWVKRKGKWQVVSRRSAPQQQIRELRALAAE
jgi:hypothetical protein